MLLCLFFQLAIDNSIESCICGIRVHSVNVLIKLRNGSKACRLQFTEREKKEVAYKTASFPASASNNFEGSLCEYKICGGGTYSFSHFCMSAACILLHFNHSTYCNGHWVAWRQVAGPGLESHPFQHCVYVIVWLCSSVACSRNKTDVIGDVMAQRDVIRRSNGDLIV